MTNSNDRPEDADITSHLIELVKIIPEEKKRELLNLMNKWDLRGKREYNRKSCLIAVDYSNQDRFYKEFIQDISAGGVFIETKEPLTEGQEIALTFSVPDSQIPLRVTGVIVRTGEIGIAVKFKQVSKYQQEIIQSLLDKM